MARRKKAPRSGRESPKKATRGGRKTLFAPTLLGLWLLVLVPPLVFIPGLGDNFRLPKLLLSEVLGLLSLALLSLRLWQRPPRWRELWRRRVLWIVAAPVLVASLGYFLGDHLEVTRRALPSLWIGAACLVGWSLGLEEDERRRALRGLLWPAGVLAGFAVLQYHDLFDPFSFQDSVTDRTGLTSLAGGAFDLSGYLVLPMLVAQEAWTGASKRVRILLGVFLVLGLWASVASRTVTALAALVVGSALLWRRRLPPRRVLGLGALAAAGLLVLVAVGPLAGRAEKMTESLRRGEINRLLTGRLDAWRCALWMVEEHPLLGVGHGAYRAEYGPARLALVEDGVEFFRGQRQVFFTNAHSDLLNTLAEWGLLGALALGFSAFVAGGELRRRWAALPRPPDPDPESDSESDSEPESGAPRPHAGRDFEVASLVALAVLCSTYFPLHLGLVAYPWLLFLSGLVAGRGDVAGAEAAR